MKKAKPQIRFESPERAPKPIPSYLLNDDDNYAPSDVNSVTIASKTAYASSHDIKMHEKTQDETQKQLPRFRDIMAKAISPTSMPYHYCRAAYEINTDEQSKKIKEIKHVIYQSDHITDVQRNIWPHIMEQRSMIVLCDLECLPQSLYLKPFIWHYFVSIDR